MLIKSIKTFETMIVYVLTVLMAVTVLFSTVELAILLWKDLATPPYLILDMNELLELFGFFLLILLGMELLETIKAYLSDGVIHVEVVMIVAIIAIARKVTILDVKAADGATLAGMGILLAALTGTYVYIKKIHNRCDAPRTNIQNPPGLP
jgi:uncharacterized membrane protein (DUF373 family)